MDELLIGKYLLEKTDRDSSAIESLFQEKMITKEEHNILLEEKTNTNGWYSICDDGTHYWHNNQNIKLNQFDEVLKKFISLQEKDTRLDLSYIHFPIITIQNMNIGGKKAIFFSNCVFHGRTDFFTEKFNSICRFEKSYFKDLVNFRGTIFNKKVFFNECIFEHNVIFLEATFNDKIYFNDAVFQKEIDLSRVHFEEFLDASNMSFNLLNLEGTHFKQPLLLGLSAYEKEQQIPLEPKHFANKESARLIKDHFEKQNNITEANKYFVIEQEKYIEELESNENMADDNKVRKLIPLYSNKIISHFGTDWVRAILFLMLWGIIADHVFIMIKKDSLVFDWKYFGFIIFVTLSYIVTYAHNVKDKILKELFFGLLLFIYILFVFNNDLNHIVKLLNPINAFKDDETFKGYEAFGAMVRIISATIIYQIIVAFRQFTRRG